MGKKLASQRRAYRGALPLYPFDASLGWRPIKHAVPFEVGRAKIAAGEWKLSYDEVNRAYYYQPASWPGLPVDDSDPAAITASESQMIAGLYGRSRTLGPRNSRAQIAPPMDAIEHSIRKLQQWPFPASRIDNGTGKPVYGDRAVRVYPKVSTQGA
jgi:hypothetical protein